MQTSEPVLTISTVVMRQQIRIDGKLYPLRNPDEMPWLLYRSKANTFLEAGRLLRIKRRTKAQEAQLDRLLPPLVESLVIAPKPVLDKLSNEHRFAIVTVFSTLLLAELKKGPGGAAAAAGARPSSKRTGRKS